MAKVIEASQTLPGVGSDRAKSWHFKIRFLRLLKEALSYRFGFGSFVRRVCECWGGYGFSRVGLLNICRVVSLMAPRGSAFRQSYEL